MFHNACFEELINPTYFMVEDYLARENMKRLGITQDFKELSWYQVEYLTFIDQVIMELKAKDNDKNRRTR